MPKHTHNWTLLYKPANTQQSKIDFFLLGRRNEYLSCECGAVGAPSHGRNRSGQRRIILLSDAQELREEADEWNSRQDVTVDT